jgi:hypothetical protein
MFGERLGGRACDLRPSLLWSLDSPRGHPRIIDAA